MYKLYTKKGIKKCIDHGENEYDILMTIDRFLKSEPNMDFLLVHYDEKNIPEWQTISGKKGFEIYLKEYKRKQLLNKSALELKNEIIKTKDLQKK